MFLDQEREYCLNVYVTQRKLQTQHNAYQNPNGILYRRKINPEKHMKPQEP